MFSDHRFAIASVQYELDQKNFSVQPKMNTIRNFGAEYRNTYDLLEAGFLFFPLALRCLRSLHLPCSQLWSVPALWNEWFLYVENEWTRISDGVLDSLLGAIMAVHCSVFLDIKGGTISTYTRAYTRHPHNFLDISCVQKSSPCPSQKYVACPDLFIQPALWSIIALALTHFSHFHPIFANDSQ